MLKGDNLIHFEKCDAITVNFSYLKENIKKMIEKYK